MSELVPQRQAFRAVGGYTNPRPQAPGLAVR